MEKPTPRRFASSRNKPNRRQGPADAPVFGNLLIEAQWKPEGDLPAHLEPWARSAGLIDDRREKDRRSQNKAGARSA